MGADVRVSGRVTRGPHYLRRDGRTFLPVGAHYVPVEGPDWPWRVGPKDFDRAFGEMARQGLDAVRIDLIWAAVEPEPGRYDDNHLRELDEILTAARRHGLLVHPTLFIGGQVGDAVWDVPWRAGRHPHADPELRALQAAHAATLASRWRGDPVVLAWDLTDEPPYWLLQDTTDEDARAWTDDLVMAIRGQDPDALVTIGTAGQEIGWGPFRADVVADLLDFACVHPYPIYEPELYPDALLSPRMTLAAAFETALASGAGRPVMVHEYGASSAQFDPEAIARYDRLLSWSSFGRGAVGYFAWCWTDAEPAAFGRAPYVRQPHETQFGVTDWTGALRPRGRVLTEVAAVLGGLDLDRFAAHGPEPAGTAIPVPHEWVRPYDVQAYGLSDAPAGPYVPAEASRNADRDPTLLVRTWLNAFVMAARAGLPVAFPRERLDGTWPDVRLLLLPAPLASTTNSLLHVRTAFWGGADPFFARGGVVYVSCSADAAIPEMEALAGCRIRDRAPANHAPSLRFVRRWGPFRSGEELELPGWDGSLPTRGVRLSLSGAEPVAVDADGLPALVVAERGSGYAVTCAFPVETLVASIPDAHGPSDRTWGLYAGLADLADARGSAHAGHPDSTAGTLLGPAGGIAVLTNHRDAPLDLEVHVPDGAKSVRIVSPGTPRAFAVEGAVAAVPLEPYGAALAIWET